METITNRYCTFSEIVYYLNVQRMYDLIQYALIWMRSVFWMFSVHPSDRRHVMGAKQPRCGVSLAQMKTAQRITVFFFPVVPSMKRILEAFKSV